MNHLGFLLVGVGAGAAYAALSMALVVTYRSSGVINFAASAIAAYAAYVYAFARKGEFVPMVPGLPATVDLPWNLSFWPALLLALVMSSIVGLLMYLLVFRPLRTAPPLARVVASIGIMLALILLITQQMGTEFVPVEDIFPEGQFNVGDTVANWRFIWTAASIVLVALGLTALFRYTRFGLATRAAAETEVGAFVSRIPAGRISALNWMLSSAVAGFGGIIVAPLVAVVPLTYALFIVPALAAAVLARFENTAIAVGASLALGALSSEAIFLSRTTDWFPQNGGPELVVLLVVVGALLLRGKPLPERGALIQRSLGRAPRPRYPWPTAVFFVAIACIALPVFQGKWREALILSFVFGTISLSYVVITGYAGQISLAQLTLAGTAAYFLSFLTISWNIPFPIAPIMAATGTMLIGVVVGLPALRIRGLSVAVVTLAFAVTVDAAWFRNTDIVGFSGGAKVDEPELFGVNLGWGFDRGETHLNYGYFALAVVAATAIGVAVLRRSQLGSAMLAVRANERSAAAAGVNVVQVKIMAFAIGSFIAGIGGAMLAYRYGTVTDSQFAPLLGLTLFASAYLAGITSVNGGVTAGFFTVGGLIFTASHEWLHLGDWYTLVTSALLIITVIFNPEGVTSVNHHLADKFHARRALNKYGAIDVPALEQVHLEPAAVDLTGRPAALQIDSLSVHYGGVTAVNEVTLTVPQGAIVGLIGPNGAGKTTMVDALTGFAPHTGVVRLGDHTLNGLKPHTRVKAGMARTFQAIELYDDLTVEENLEVGLASGRQGHGHAAKESLRDTTEVLGIDHLRGRPAGDLSQGQRQLVSIGRALVAQPDVLLLDEPAAGLDSAESEWLGFKLRDIRDQGVTILMVDHDVNLVLNLCDYIAVLDFGKLIAEGAPNEIRNNPAVIAAYLGATHSDTLEEVIDEVHS